VLLYRNLFLNFWNYWLSLATAVVVVILTRENIRLDEFLSRLLIALLTCFFLVRWHNLHFQFLIRSWSAFLTRKFHVKCFLLEMSSRNRFRESLNRIRFIGESQFIFFSKFYCVLNIINQESNNLYYSQNNKQPNLCFTFLSVFSFEESANRIDFC